MVAMSPLAVQAQTGSTTTATTIVSNGLVVAYTVTDDGVGYTKPPTVTVVNGSDAGATALAQIAHSVVTQLKGVVAANG